MNHKTNIFVSIFQLAVGVAGILSFIVLGMNGENLVKWIGTLLLSIAFAAMGLIGINDYRNNR